MMTSVDIDRLYHDLINALSITFRGSSKVGLTVAVLEDIYNAYQEKNYDRIVEWAVQEGFNLEDYYV